MTRKATKKQLDVYNSYLKKGGYKTTAHEFDIHWTTVRDHVKAVEEKLERAEYIVEQLDGVHTVDEALQKE